MTQGPSFGPLFSSHLTHFLNECISSQSCNYKSNAFTLQFSYLSRDLDIYIQRPNCLKDFPGKPSHKQILNSSSSYASPVIAARLPNTINRITIHSDAQASTRNYLSFSFDTSNQHPTLSIPPLFTLTTHPSFLLSSSVLPLLWDRSSPLLTKTPT